METVATEMVAVEREVRTHVMEVRMHVMEVRTHRFGFFVEQLQPFQ